MEACWFEFPGKYYREPRTVPFDVRLYLKTPPVKGDCLSIGIAVPEGMDYCIHSNLTGKTFKIIKRTLCLNYQNSYNYLLKEIL